jgi:hypothetical protein
MNDEQMLSSANLKMFVTDEKKFENKLAISDGSLEEK